jgi:hypothetical protein
LYLLKLAIVLPSTCSRISFRGTEDTPSIKVPQRMRVIGGEEAGGSAPAPCRDKIENSAATQTDRRCSFIAWE